MQWLLRLGLSLGLSSVLLLPTNVAAAQPERIFDERDHVLVATVSADGSTAFIVDDHEDEGYGTGPLLKVGLALSDRWALGVQYLDTEESAYGMDERQAYLEGRFFNGRVFDFSLRAGAARREIDDPCTEFCNDLFTEKQNYLLLGFNMRVNIGRYVMIEGGFDNFRNDDNNDGRIYVMPTFNAGGPLALSLQLALGGETTLVAAGLRYRF